MSRYKEYLDGIPFARPDWSVSFMLVLTSISVFFIGKYFVLRMSTLKLKGAPTTKKINTIRIALKDIIKNHYTVILLFLTALFFLRSAVGRADLGHFTYSIQWLYLFLVFLGVNYFAGAFKKYSIALSLGVIMVTCSILLFYAGLIHKIDLAKDTFPIHTNDSDYMRTDYKQTADYLKQSLKPNESFVTLTSEGSWYYFADKPSPTRYYVAWYAYTAPQRKEIANTLANNKNVKFVVTNNNWTSTFDYVPNSERFPEVYSVLNSQFVPYTGFGQQTVWIRK